MFNRWNHYKLKTKLLWSYGILMLIPMILLSVFVFETFSSSIKKKIIYSANQGFSQTYDFLEYKFTKVIDVLDQLSNNSDIRQMVTTDLKNDDIKQQYWNMIDIRQTFQELQKKEDISRIRLYIEDQILYAGDGINMFGMKDMEGSVWFEELMKTEESILGLTYDDIKESEENRLPILSFAGKMKSTTDYSETIGYLRVDMPKSNIEEILKKADTTNDSVTYLANNKNEVVASSKTGDFPVLGIDQEEVERMFLEGQDGFSETATADGKMLVCQKYLYHSGWTMVTLIPYHSFMAEINSMQLKFFGIMVLAAIFVCLMIYFIGKSITDRVENLVFHMKRVQNGESYVQIGDGGEDEVGELYKNFDYMIDKTKNLLDEKYEMGKSVKNAELKALQAQINPHFLYNTLDMIKWYSYSNKTKEINEIVTETAKFYKMTLNKGKGIVTLKEEIEHSLAYLAIQNMRFENSIRVDFNVPDEILECQVPKITLQPLIENAILHGILEKDDPQGCISLGGEIRENEIVLFLSDDGIGMEQDTADRILKGEVKPSKGSGFGVRNIHERIQILWGNEYGLSYRSVPYKGTTVEVHLKKMV